MSNDPRFTKAEATYQAESNRRAKCARCDNFREQDTCTLVKGSISPNGWCRLYDGPESKRGPGRPRKEAA